MTFRMVAKSRVTGKLRLPISRHVPQGLHLARDIARLLPLLQMRQIFDVGANRGQTAVEYAATFPSARIDSFEPVASTYADLVKLASKNKRIHCHQLALGSSAGTSRMVTEGPSETFRMGDDGNEVVTTTTADHFCDEHGIAHINLFKIDTEGYDLEVLRGAEVLIKQDRIDLIQVEAGMNPENTHHVYFEEFTAFLHEFDYRLFGIYEQTYEVPTNRPNLRRSNMVFLSATVASATH